MKNIFLILLLIPSLVYGGTVTSGTTASGCAFGVAAGGGGSCAISNGDSCTVATDDTTAGLYIGQGNWYPASNMNICQIDVWIVTAPSGDSITGYVFNMSGTSLGTEVCHTESKAYSTITAGAFNTFSITGDCNVTGGGGSLYAIVWTNPDASWEAGDRSVSGGCTTPGGLGTWGADKAIDGNYLDTYDELIRVYGK